MAQFIVREIHEGEEASRRGIVAAATEELRRTYRPRDTSGRCGGKPSGVLVAFHDNTPVGTAEYVLNDNHLYVQGVAVRPESRGQGACRALLNFAEEIARLRHLPVLKLCAIEETGNVAIFERLGFRATHRAVARHHVRPDGGPVTQVDMERAVV